jgi:hypothetical protein
VRLLGHHRTGSVRARAQYSESSCEIAIGT